MMNSRRLASWTLLAALAACGCDRPVATPSLKAVSAASASPFAVDVAFDRPQSRLEVANKSHYSIRRVGADGPGAVPQSVQFIDTLFGETVRTTFPLGTLEDSTLYEVTVRGARDAYGNAYLPGDSVVAAVRTGLNYDSPLQEVLDRRCNRCHAGAAPAAGYRTNSFASLFGFGSDSAAAHPIHNLIPGDAQCLLVVKTGPKGKEFSRAHLTYAESELFRNWVVSYQARR